MSVQRLLRAFVLTCLWLSGQGIALAQSVQTSAPIAYLFDVGTKSALFAKAADELHPPASLVKLLTAETVFHAMAQGEITPEQEFQVSEHAWRRGGAPSGGAAMFAPLNSRVAVSNLVQGLVVQSANDAALVLAEGIAKSESEFVKRMQTRAAAIDLSRSQFRNPTGFAHPEQRVTAREMARLAMHLIEAYPDQYALFSQREFTWNNIRQTNRNPMLALNIGADGLKTGNIGEAGFNLVASAVQDGRRLIVVIMGADSAQTRATEARKLLEWGFRNFERRTLLQGNVPLTEARLNGGEKRSLPLGLAQNLDMLLPKSAQDNVSVRLTYKAPIKAPIASGQVVGNVSILRGDVLAFETALVALEPADAGSLTRRAMDNSWDWLASVVRRIWTRS